MFFQSMTSWVVLTAAPSEPVAPPRIPQSSVTSAATTCPADNRPVVDKSGVTLYPVDSEFGFYVVDFLGAQGKIRDGDYLEGFVGNIVENGVQSGHPGLQCAN